jgi:hypothetical protein
MPPVAHINLILAGAASGASDTNAMDAKTNNITWIAINRQLAFPFCHEGKHYRHGYQRNRKRIAQKKDIQSQLFESDNQFQIFVVRCYERGHYYADAQAEQRSLIELVGRGHISFEEIIICFDINIIIRSFDTEAFGII